MRGWSNAASICSHGIHGSCARHEKQFPFLFRGGIGDGAADGVVPDAQLADEVVRAAQLEGALAGVDVQLVLPLHFENLRAAAPVQPNDALLRAADALKVEDVVVVQLKEAPLEGLVDLAPLEQPAALGRSSGGACVGEGRYGAD